MSHYPLAVFTESKPDDDDLHRIMAPYEETGRNPQSKWDWWRVGGRWLGQLLIKPGTHHAIIGVPGAYGNRADPPEAVDGARVGDLDLPAMLERRRSELGKAWDDAREFQDTHGRPMFMAPHADTVSRDDYVASATPFTPFAYIHDGQWYESGEMGFLGTVRNEKPEDEWEQQFAGVLKQQPDDHWMTVLDCHI